MATKIVYEDKVALSTKPDTADKNKITASDMNAIKTSVNELVDETAENKARTDLIVEDIGEMYSTGENEYGAWIKFGDGTVICRGSYSFNSGISTALPHGGYRTSGKIIQFPANFVSGPDTIVATSTSDTNDNGFIINANNTTASEFSGYWWTVNSFTESVEHSLQYIAIGEYNENKYDFKLQNMNKEDEIIEVYSDENMTDKIMTVGANSTEQAFIPYDTVYISRNASVIASTDCIFTSITNGGKIDFVGVHPRISLSPSYSTPDRTV